MEKRIVPAERKSANILGVGAPLIPRNNHVPHEVTKPKYEHHEEPEDYYIDNDDGGIPMSDLVGDWDKKVEEHESSSIDDIKRFVGEGNDISGIPMNEELKGVLENNQECDEEDDEYPAYHDDHCCDSDELDEPDEPEEVSIAWDNDSDDLTPFLIVSDWRGRQLFFYVEDIENPTEMTTSVNGHYDWLKHLIPNIIFRTGNPKTFLNENAYMNGGRFIDLGKDPNNHKINLIAFYYLNEDIEEESTLIMLSMLFEKYVNDTPFSHYERNLYCSELIASDEETDAMMKDFASNHDESSDEDEDEVDDSSKEDISDNEDDTPAPMTPVDFNAIASTVAEQYGATAVDESEDTSEDENEEDVPAEENVEETETVETKVKEAPKTSKKKATSNKSAAKDDMIVEQIRKPAKKK